MNIGFQADIIQGHRTGIGNYTLQMLRALKHVDPELRFLNPQISGWKEVPLSEADEVSKIDVGVKTRRRFKTMLGNVPGTQAAYRLSRSLALGMTYRSKGVSIFHAFNFLPATRPSAPTLPVVYDLSFIRYPEMHPVARVKWLERLPKTVERAPFVHTISKFSQMEIATTLNFPIERIFVAYPAAGQHFFRQGENVRTIQLATMKLQWKRYLLAVGTLEPRKNLKTLLTAYAALPSSVRAAYPLVIAGGQGWGSQRVSPAVERLIQLGAIRFLGYVSDLELSCLYEGANLMLYPSIYEGFGMPVVEAMACGTPVAHSSGTSMDEIGGDLLTKISAMDVDAWATCIQEAVDRTDSTGDADARVVRTQFFNWVEGAKTIRQVYDKILSSA